MSEAYAEETTPQPKSDKRRLDRWLSAAIAVLVGAILLLGGYFAYSVYANARRNELTNAPIRLIKALETQVRREPNNVILRVRLGEAYGAAGRFDEAVEQFNQALKIEPNHVGAYLDLGMVAMLNDQLPQAENYFKKVVELTDDARFSNVDERRENAIYNLGLLKLEQSEYEQAAGFFKEALRIRKDASDTYVNLAKALRGMGDVEAAIDNIEIALAFDPGFAQAHYMLGEIYRDRKDDVNASYHFYRAAELAPGDDIPAEALAAYGPASDWISKAKAAAAAKQWDKAVEYVLVARNLEPKNVEGALLHADILEQRGDIKDAIEVALEGVKLAPSEERASSLLARLAEANPKVALTVYRAELKKEPDNEELKARIAELSKN